MSILSGASVSQLLALSSVPRGLRTTRILSMRAGAVIGLPFPLSFPTTAHAVDRESSNCAGRSLQAWIPGRTCGPPGMTPRRGTKRYRVSCPHPFEDRFEYALDRRARRRRALFVDRRWPILWRRTVGLLHVGAAGEFQLHSLDAFARAPIGARDPAAFEAAIDDGRLPAPG